MQLASRIVIVTAIVASVVPAIAAASDAELLRQLESATTVAEFGGAVSSISKRRETGPLDPAYADPIVIKLAAGLALEWNLNWSAAEGVANVLRQSDRPLPDAAVASLFSALEHPAMLNRSGAIQVLGTLPAQHAQLSRAIDSMSELLRFHEHQHTRTSAAIALKELGEKVPPPESAISALIDAAMNDEYLTVRIDAGNTLSYQSLERTRAEPVTASLAAELIKPTEVTSRARGLAYFNRYPDRALQLLARMYQPPYPTHVIDSWVAQASRPGYQGALEVLRAAVVRGELSAGQQERLLAVARNAYTQDQRSGIYATAFAAATLADIDAATQLLAMRSGSGDRLAAAQQLHSYYKTAGVPQNVAEIAAAQFTDEPDPDVALALALLLLDATDADQRGQQLIDGLVAHADQPQTWGPVVPLLSLNHAEQLVVQTAGDDTLSANFRYMVLNDFKTRADNGGTLPPVVAESLDSAARFSNDYQVSQGAGEALAAWSERMPLRVKLANRHNQSTALGILFLVLCAVNAVAAIAGLVSVMGIPLQTKNDGLATAKRSGLVIGWLLLSVAMFVLIIIAFVGFLGHNSAPPPSLSLKLNIPLYCGTVVYVALAWLAMRKARRAKNEARVGTAAA